MWQGAFPRLQAHTSLCYKPAMTHDIKTILKAIPLFKTLDDREIEGLSKLMAMQKFEANQPIMVEGHPPPGLYVLLEGKVAVMKGKGNAADHICDLDAGECIGEIEIIENAPCSASVVAYGSVNTAVIVEANLNNFMNSQPRAAIKILRQMVVVLGERLRKSNISYSSLMTIAESVGN